MRAQGRPQLAVVVPCFNEREALPQLFKKLEQAEASFGQQVNVHWCFVDDGSTDGTGTILHEYARAKPNCTVARHEANRGIAAAILTGAAVTQAPLVGSMDADCTYDPLELAAMAERLADDVDVVTASPYHPQGRVEGVASWRLFLSKAASVGYRRVHHNKLYTYTSCFRIYRREVVSNAAIAYPRFAGVAELLWHIDRRGGKVVEHPAVLMKRSVGRSKLRLLPAVWEHARLLSRCAGQRLLDATCLSPRFTSRRRVDWTHAVRETGGSDRSFPPAADGDSNL